MWRANYKALRLSLAESSDRSHIRRYNSAMVVVDDVRKLLQDLVTPEMRALSTEVRGLKENMGTLRGDLNDKIDSLRVEMNRRFDYLETSFRLDERVSTLEEEQRKERRRQ